MLTWHHCNETIKGAGHAQRGWGASEKGHFCGSPAADAGAGNLPDWRLVKTRHAGTEERVSLGRGTGWTDKRLREGAQGQGMKWRGNQSSSPAADVVGGRLLEVGPMKTRHGQEDDVLLGVVAALPQEGEHAGLDLVIALLGPFSIGPGDGGVIHLVDGNHQLGNAQGLGQLGMLSRLPSPLKTRLKLTLCTDSCVRWVQQNYYPLV